MSVHNLQERGAAAGSRRLSRRRSATRVGVNNSRQFIPLAARVSYCTRDLQAVLEHRLEVNPNRHSTILRSPRHSPPKWAPGSHGKSAVAATIEQATSPTVPGQQTFTFLSIPTA